MIEKLARFSGRKTVICKTLTPALGGLNRNNIMVRPGLRWALIFRKGEAMLYMVIEHYKEGAHSKIYERFSAKGRMMPPEVTYINSWVETDFRRCFQLMEAPNQQSLDQWIANWNDLVDFEVVKVMTSKEAQERAKDGN